MIEIFREYSFEAAHHLTNVPSEHKCAKPHGHSYRLLVTVQGDAGKDSGWVMDFADIDNWVKPVVARLDHTDLNLLVPNPTAENLVLWITQQLKAHCWKFKGTGICAIELWETARGGARYRWPHWGIL